MPTAIHFFWHFLLSLIELASHGGWLYLLYVYLFIALPNLAFSIYFSSLTADCSVSNIWEGEKVRARLAKIADSPGLGLLRVTISHRKYESEEDGKDIQARVRGEAASSTHYWFVQIFSALKLYRHVMIGVDLIIFSKPALAGSFISSRNYWEDTFLKLFTFKNIHKQC